MLPSLFIGPDTHNELASLLASGRTLTVSGLSNETAKAMLISHLMGKDPGRATGARERRGRAVVITEDESHCEALLHWLRFFEQEPFLLRFPEEDFTSEDVSTVIRLLEGRGVAITDRQTWDRQLPLFSELVDRSVELAKGQSMDFTPFFSTLIDLGYVHSDDKHLIAGQYHRTGDVLDIFPVGAPAPLRISFSFDAIERIQRVDQNTGEVEDLDAATIFPLTWEHTAALADQLCDATVTVDEQEEIALPDDAKKLIITSFRTDS